MEETIVDWKCTGEGEEGEERKQWNNLVGRSRLWGQECEGNLYVCKKIYEKMGRES